MKGIKCFFSGRRDFDPEGYPVRIGALWSRLFQPGGWALVAFGTIWVRNEATFDRFRSDERWRAHEHHHIYQELHRFSSTLTYLLAFVWQYLRYRSHDRAPLEVEADAAADRHMERMAKGRPTA